MVAVPKVVIAGGGIVGTSIAYFLAPADVELVLVDPVGIAPAASAKAGGFLARTWRDGTVLQDMQRRGFALHQELANELGADRIDYRRLSCYSVAVGRQGPAHPSEVKWADLNVRDCTSMGQPEDIAQVHPRKLCQTLWNETVQRSPTATLRQGRIVKALTDSNGSSKAVTGVQLDDGSTLDADVLVCACGPWTHEAQTWFNDDNDDNVKAAHSSTSILPTITSVKCHSMLVANPEPLDQAVFFTSLDADLLDPEADVEVYPRPDGDCYVNGFPDEEGIISEQPGQEEVVDDEIALLQQAMERTSSILGKMEPHTTQVNSHCLVGGTHNWTAMSLFPFSPSVSTFQACYWPESPDGLPCIGPIPGISGAFMATGHSVWGILQGPITGKAVAELILNGESSTLDLTPFGLERFANL